MSASAAQLAIGWNVPPHGESLDMRFRRFTHEHPDTVRALVWLARDKVADDVRNGRAPHVGSKALLERLRWRGFPLGAPTYVHTAVSCDNSFSSRVARLLAADYEDIASVFELRELNA